MTNGSKAICKRCQCAFPACDLIEDYCHECILDLEHGDDSIDGGDEYSDDSESIDGGDSACPAPHTDAGIAGIDGGDSACPAPHTSPEHQKRAHVCGRAYIPQNATYCWFCHCG